MFGDVGFIIAQIISVAAVVTGFISFQMKSARGILLFQIITAFLFVVHYIMLGAFSAAALNFISAIRCVLYYIRNKKNSNNLLLPFIFAIILVITSILTWEGWYSALIMVGLMISTISLSLPNPQHIRAAVLIKAPLCLVYNICVYSLGGVVFEIATLGSAIIGLIKNRKKAN